MQAESPEIPWRLATRIAFRFVFAYLLLFLIPSRVFGWLPFGNWLATQWMGLWHRVVLWVGHAVVHTTYDISQPEGPVSNSAHATIELACYVVVAAIATVVWSILDRRRTSYTRLNSWFRLLLRLALAPAMIHYGMLKILPTQMISPPPPGVQSMRVGELMPMQMLWTFMGTSRACETLTGIAELAGGVLLLFSRTTLLGALISLGDMLMVFTLNMCFDVHVKAWSLHLLLMSAVLAAPAVPRLARVLLARGEPALSRNRWLARLPHAIVLAYGLFHVGKYALETKDRYAKMYPPRPLFYGVWSVAAFSPTDAPQRWRYVTFREPGKVTIESTSGTKASYPRSGLTVTQADAHTLLVSGTWNGTPVRAKLTSMPLVSQPFRWIYVFGPEE